VQYQTGDVMNCELIAKYDLKLKAETLRREGKSISEIAKILRISKGTSSMWCRNILLSKKQSIFLHKKMVKSSLVGRLKGAQMNHVKKVLSLVQAKQWAIEQYKKTVHRQKYFSAGIALYWAGGSKTESTNSFYL